MSWNFVNAHFELLEIDLRQNKCTVQLKKVKIRSREINDIVGYFIFKFLNRVLGIFYNKSVSYGFKQE